LLRQFVQKALGFVIQFANLLGDKVATAHQHRRTVHHCPNAQARQRLKILNGRQGQRAFSRRRHEGTGENMLGGLLGSSGTPQGFVCIHAVEWDDALQSGSPFR